MLYKKIFILKGKKGEGSLKVTRLENAYTTLELNVPKGDYLCAVVQDGYSEVFEYTGGKLAKRIPYSDYYPTLTVTDRELNVAYCNAAYPNVSPLLEYKRNLERERVAETEKEDLSPLLSDDKENKVEYGNSDEEKHVDESDVTLSATSIDERFGVEGFLDTGVERDTAFLEDFEEKYKTAAHEITLESLARESKWIASEDQKTAVGVLYNSSGATHLCYAEKGERTSPPTYPAEWLDGYWITYEEL